MVSTRRLQGGEKMESNEMKVLRAFVEEFSPLHQGETKGMSYDQLFSIVSDIVDSHYEDINEDYE